MDSEALELEGDQSNKLERRRIAYLSFAIAVNAIMGWRRSIGSFYLDSRSKLGRLVPGCQCDIATNWRPVESLILQLPTESLHFDLT
jgi:hypothetical protein